MRIVGMSDSERSDAMSSAQARSKAERSAADMRADGTSASARAASMRTSFTGSHEQRRRVAHPVVRRHRRHRAGGRRAHERVRIVLGAHREPAAGGTVVARKVERARPHDRGLRTVGDDGVQPGQRRGRTAPRGREHFAEQRLLPPAGTEPLRDRVRRPLRRLPVVASVARVRRADLHREVRARHAEAVVGPRVDHHVVLRRHVAVRATGAGGCPADGGDALRSRSPSSRASESARCRPAGGTARTARCPWP